MNTVMQALRGLGQRWAARRGTRVVFPSKRPLELPQLIMRRSVLLLLAGLVGVAGLSLLRLREDVASELDAALLLARVTAQISVMHRMDDAQALSQLESTLRQAREQGAQLRHLSLQVQDSAGRDLFVSSRVAPSSPDDDFHALAQTLMPLVARVLDADAREAPATVRWQVSRPQGPDWTVALQAEPASERLEGLNDLLFFLGFCAAFGVAIVLVLSVNTRVALRPLALMMDAIDHWSDGGRQRLQSLPGMPVAELQALAATLQHLDAQLQAAETARRHMSRQVITLQEEERQHLAGELHDELGQHLTALRVDLDWVQHQLKRPLEAATQQALLTLVQGMAERQGHVQQLLRQLLRRLRPLALAEGQDLDVQLCQPLRALAAGWNVRPALGTRFELRLQAHDAQGQPLPWAEADPALLPPGLALALYRISQEALTNVARHAQARHATLCLHWQQAPGGAWLDWACCDDGLGLADPGPALLRGSGLSGLQARIWAHGAELRCGPHPGAPASPGLCLRARFVLGQPQGPVPPEVLLFDDDPNPNPVG